MRTGAATCPIFNKSNSAYFNLKLSRKHTLTCLVYIQKSATSEDNYKYRKHLHLAYCYRFCTLTCKNHISQNIEPFWVQSHAKDSQDIKVWYIEISDKRKTRKLVKNTQNATTCNLTGFRFSVLNINLISRATNMILTSLACFLAYYQTISMFDNNI